MTYAETVQYLFRQVPSFQKVGKDGYKEGLENTLLLDEHFQHPHKQFKSIHVAGTNGKGSTAHTLAAIMQQAGYKVGLYTSPHLLDFRERIKVNGTPIPQQTVVNFVEEQKTFFEPLSPSFFELTTAMAFWYFANCKVDYAIIEVGLGGKLDCTNIITPVLSIITNISFDHMQFLGNTLPQIAREKAGIIKPNIPVVIGEKVPETEPVFLQTAQEAHAPIHFAQEHSYVLHATTTTNQMGIDYQTTLGNIHGELSGLYQVKNTNTILCAIEQLQKQGISIPLPAIQQGFSQVCSLTGLQGRWQKLAEQPLTICDTGHNEGGFHYIAQQLQSIQCSTLHIVFGMVSDKDISSVLSQLPKNATYYFTQAQIPRALSAEQLQAQAANFHLHGKCFSNVSDALSAAQQNAIPTDCIYIGGSTFIVADLLEIQQNRV